MFKVQGSRLVRPLPGNRRSVVWPALLTAVLLILPAMALHRRGADLRWVGAYAAVISALAYWAYARDKRSAGEGHWRISESNLHLLEMLGGWPGAFLAQRRLRHKCSKPGYQVVFWLIVLAYQAAALDSLQHWQLCLAGFARVFGR
jgi:uncharacterized membrane protein YsdA (DUF1294 family)